MRKKVFLVIGIAITILLFITLLFGVTNKHQTLTFNTNGCQVIFECTPKEFFNKELEFYGTVGDFRESAYIDSEGNLNLILTSDQLFMFKQSQYLDPFEETKNNSNILLSCDLKSITFYSNPETYEKDVECLNRILGKIGVIQLIDGVSKKDVRVNITEIDAITGDIIFCEDVYFG